MSDQPGPAGKPPLSGSATHEAASGSDEIYARHEKIYPRAVHGIFANLRVLGILTLLGAFYGIAWMQWDGHQAVLLDLPARKFYIFGLTFWPQDFFYFAWLLIIAALALFFFTALAGRLWCGYACPQTVWTDVFLWIERKIEGSRNQQIKRDKSRLTASKFRIKALKHFIWITFSLYTGFTFVGYFTPIQELTVETFKLNLGPWETFWIFFYGFATYGNAGWMREQVCMYMCPYARFQSAMFDKDTLIIAYDEKRGDPRGSRKRSADPKQQNLGDCVDCTLCVQVCPTGIDIRNGMQYECIGCAACIDVCDHVMDKMGYAQGLVRYTTENTLEGQASRIIRPRIILYTILLSALSLSLVYSISQRIPMELDIIRDRNALYRETPDGLIENIYILKLINMDDQVHHFQLSVHGLPGMELVLKNRKIQVESGEILSIPASVQIDPVELTKPVNQIEFTASSTDSDLEKTKSARFLGPMNGR